VLQSRGGQLAFDWDRPENYLVIHDRPVGQKVTSTKCHKMQRFACKWICIYDTFTIESRNFYVLSGIL